jgi:hypothetical protein
MAESSERKPLIDSETCPKSNVLLILAPIRDLWIMITPLHLECWLITCGKRHSILKPFNSQVRIGSRLYLSLNCDMLSFVELINVSQVLGKDWCLLRSGVHKHRGNFVPLSFCKLNLLPGIGLHRIDID